MKRNAVKLILFVLVMHFAIAARAFPELVRHGYVNCTSCHVSPSGGGILTPYGRSLSREILSTWGKENEELVGHGFLPAPPEWLNIGGDYRAIQTYLDTATTERASLFPMQTDAEVAIAVQKFIFDATVGIEGGPKQAPKRGEFISRRHYVLYQASETMAIRAGRFYPQFGINIPDHTAYTRRDNGFDQDDETYNLEWSHSGETNDFYLTAIGGRFDEKKDTSEKGLSASYSYAIKNESKVGVSALATDSTSQKRKSLGLFGIVKGGEKIYVLTELDYLLHYPDAGSSSQGMLTYLQAAYEATKGVHLYGVQQVSYRDFDDVRTRRDSYGAGVKFYPRPHFEFVGQFLRERDMQFSPDRYEVAWLLLHYYL